MFPINLFNELKYQIIHVLFEEPLLMLLNHLLLKYFNFVKHTAFFLLSRLKYYY